MSNGWIALHRQILDTDLWTSEKFTRGQAWIDLVMLANHKDGYIRVRGIKIAVKRGQCGYSEQRLSDRWGWSRGKVRRFFDELEADNQITRETDNKKTVITICNYCKYQDKLKSDGTTNGQQTEQQTDNKRYSNNNGNNGNNENNIDGGVKKTPVIDIPSFIDGDIWLDWVNHRKDIKKALKPTTVSRQIKQLEKWHNDGHDVNEIINASITNGYTGLFEPKKGNVKNGKRSIKEQGQELLEQCRNGAFDKSPYGDM